MNHIPLPVKDAYIVEFPRFSDDRGWLQEIYNEEKYPEEITRFFPVRQGTVSTSRKNVIRGLHISTYSKLLTCLSGSVYDVVVDVRPESPTYLQWAGVTLTADNHRQLFIPPNCGHGFMALEDNSTVVYSQGGCFNPAKRSDTGISPFDPIVNVQWPLGGAAPVVSQKDQDAENLEVVSDLKIQPKRKRFLIVGASGQVGSALMESLNAQKDKYVAVGTYNTNPRPGMTYFDMEKAAVDPSRVDLLLEMCRPDVVIICAAFSWVDGNELHKDKAEAVNVLATEAIAKGAKKLGAKVVFYSSDYVFDGVNNNKSLNHEGMEANPPNSYGTCKVRAEHMVLGVSLDNLVLRISRVYGPDDQGKNFIYQVLRNSKEGKPLNCLTDEVSSGTYNRDIVLATLRLVAEDKSGTYHVSGPEPWSKYHWGEEVAKYFKLNPSFLVKTTQEEGKAPAKRPKYCALDTTKIRTVFPDFKFRTLTEAFEDWKKNPRGQPIDWPN